MSTPQELVVAEIRNLTGTLAYANDLVGPTLATIKRLGRADCSDVTHAVFGAYGYPIGNMSYEQAVNGVEVAFGNTVSQFLAIVPLLRQADIVCMAIDGARRGVISHVETIVADASAQSIGHGGPGHGPIEGSITRWNLLGSSTLTRWTVRRIINQPTQVKEDEMTPDEHNILLNINNMLRVDGQPFGYPQATHNALGTVINDQRALAGRVAGIETAVTQLAGGDKIDMGAIIAAVEKGYREGAAAITAADVAAQLEVKAK